jgi:hypothetical protein
MCTVVCACIFISSKQKTPPVKKGPYASYRSPALRGTALAPLLLREEPVAGLHRAVPSTSLDKVYSVVMWMLTRAKSACQRELCQSLPASYACAGWRWPLLCIATSSPRITRRE